MRTIVNTLIFLAAASIVCGLVGYCLAEPNWISAAIGAGAGWVAWKTHPWRSE